MKPRATKGLFVSIEGGEGAGKTTLIDGLIRRLTVEGASVVNTREPGGTQLGAEIRKLLLHASHEHPIVPKAELMLFLADRAQHYAQVIVPALQQGCIVITDRFHDSTVAYQGIARGMGQEAVNLFSLYVTDGIEPDLTIYLDIDPRIGCKRGRRVAGQEVAREKADRIENEGMVFHDMVRTAFLKIAMEAPDRVHVINAEQPPESVLEEALGYIHDHLEALAIEEK